MREAAYRELVHHTLWRWADGKAGRQWEAAVVACRVPGLVRRLSWQRLMAAMAGAPELAYLIHGTGRKYGLMPD